MPKQSVADLNPQGKTFLVRVDASSLDIAAYQQEALTFLAEVEREVAALKGWKAAK